MYNITLICTLHNELGKCNSKELHKIIEIVNPEIIFEELSCFNFDACYKEQSLSTLETNAIKEYLEKHQVEHIPVDTYELTNSYYKDFDYMHKQVISNSIEYRKLLDRQSSLVNQYGFMYLNSNKCNKLIKKLNILESNVIKSTNNEKLHRIYKSCMEITDKREYEIINNIYNYSYEHRYNKALLFIGAGHRKSIIEKIRKYKMEKELIINWRFNSYKNVL